jgi:hypothetical protein
MKMELEGKTVKVDEVGYGECFKYDREYYIAVGTMPANVCEVIDGRRLAVNIVTGTLKSMLPKTTVYQVNLKAVRV